MDPKSVSELIYWSYANLAMAQDGVERGLDRYDRLSFMIRSRLYKGLCEGRMQIRSLFDDEKYKIENGARCVYCGRTDGLSVDHLFPKVLGGSDSSDNLMCCCRRCNSSKGDRDMVLWLRESGQFPPLMVLRRYLKLVHQFCSENGLLEEEYRSVDDSSFPFKFEGIPTDYPVPGSLTLLIEQTQKV